jgi:hypothetical protein
MTNVAYVLFTFIACILGLGLGLVLHQLWSGARRLTVGEQDPFGSMADGETAAWDAYSKWQADNNRRFATQVISCGAAPLVIAGLAWTQRSDVVGSVCSAFVKVVGEAYICTL